MAFTMSFCPRRRAEFPADRLAVLMLAHARNVRLRRLEEVAQLGVGGRGSSPHFHSCVEKTTPHQDTRLWLVPSVGDWSALAALTSGRTWIFPVQDAECAVPVPH